jgi:hypothetical protein
VNKAIDWVIDKIVGLAKKVWAKIKALAKKLKDKLKAAGKKVKDKFGKKPEAEQMTEEEKKKQRLSKAMTAALSALNKFSGRTVTAILIKPVLLGIRLRYRLTTLEPVRQGDVWAIHGAINPEDTKKTGLKAKTKEPPTLSVGDAVEAKWGNTWAISEVTALTEQTFSYTGHTHRGPVSGTTRLELYGQTWREYKPGRTKKVGEAFEAIRNLSEWTSYADASQVLSYRAHGKFNVPPGKNWHHIHESSGGGKNSVDNLALVGWRINQVDFNNWFARPQRGTLGQPLRQFLKGQGEQAHIDWGMRCIRAHGLSVVKKNEGRGPYQEIV